MLPVADIKTVYASSTMEKQSGYSYS